MFNRFVNERTILIVTSVGIFYFLYMKYLELVERQDYLERNVARVVDHLNKQTIDEVVRESFTESSDEEPVQEERELDEDVTSISVEVGDSTADEMADNMIDRGMETDEYSYLPSHDEGAFGDESYDHPNTVPDTETIIIKSSEPDVVHSGERKGFVAETKPKTKKKPGRPKKSKKVEPTPMEPTELDAMAVEES